ncbi:hypothetical protein ILUMI_09572 [Ignelater luminosus]|uniref:Uncharacterized protein n=1 Tax=Ignelater luminosus TaxID=2038154 RepID=A0A8K0CZH0_IGNLU|nr:hypothetical protein ILUMI_09572 [Ignelater luminosus]
MKGLTIILLTVIATGFLIQDTKAQGIKDVMNAVKNTVRKGVDKIKEGAGKLVDAVKGKLTVDKQSATQTRAQSAAGLRKIRDELKAQLEKEINGFKPLLQKAKENLEKLDGELLSLEKKLIREIQEKLSGKEREPAAVS